MTTGGQLIIVPKTTAMSPSAFLTLLEQRRVTILNQTPSAFLRLLNIVPNRSTQQWGAALRAIIFGGEALDLSTLTTWYTYAVNPATQMINMYGITETTVHVTYRAITQADLDSPDTQRSIGRPLTDLHVHILDAHGNPVLIGVKGEMYVSGAGLARGYVKRGDLTAERFVPNPFCIGHDKQGTENSGQMCSASHTRLYKTGDLARYLPDGAIEFLGRKDHQVKIRGFRIELGEIESALTRHPAIDAAIVLTTTDRGHRDRLIAYYTAGESLPVSVVRAHLTQILPDYMIPVSFTHLTELPLTTNGKVDRKALSERVAQSKRPELAIQYVAPTNPMEIKLVRIWQEVLTIEHIGIHDNFFDLGGESFAAYRLMARIADIFHRELPLVAIFQSPTIARLATAIQTRIDQEETRALVQIQPGLADRLPFFCVHPAGGDILIFQQLAQHLGADQPFYGIQSLGRLLEDRPHTTLEDMTAHYTNEICTLQPNGPYLISGHSMGGVVAFEIARQLEAQGKEIGLLAIFDADIITRSTSMLDTLLLVSDIFDLKFSRAELSRREGTDMMTQILKQAKKKFAKVLEIAYAMDILPRGFRTKDAELFLNRIATNIDLMSAYIPGPINSKVTMFLATEHTENAQPIDLDTWRSLTKGGLDVIPVPGNHLNLVKLPHVRTLSRHLRALVDHVHATCAQQP